MIPEEEETNTGETEDLDAAFLAEDPSILTPAELKDIATGFDLSDEQMKTIVRDMSRTRRNFAKQEDNYSN
jgi:hypothetical protein